MVSLTLSFMLTRFLLGAFLNIFLVTCGTEKKKADIAKRYLIVSRKKVLNFGV